MNAETLERLMLDRALGALSPDCEVLLTGYLELRPEAGVACRGIQQTVDLARRALAAGPDEPIPAFPSTRFMHARRNALRWRTARAVMGVAACVLIGFGIHAVLFPATRSQPPQHGPYLVAQGGTSVEANPETGGFWSGRRLYERAAGATQPSAGRLIWHSPVATPRVGDAT